MSVDIAQRRLVEAIAGMHETRTGSLVKDGNPLAALALGVALARLQAGFDGNVDVSLSPVLRALEGLILAGRDDLVQWTDFPL